MSDPAGDPPPEGTTSEDAENEGVDDRVKEILDEQHGTRADDDEDTTEDE
jgi:hypothetical protein